VIAHFAERESAKMCFGFDTSFSHIVILCILALTVFSTFLVAPLPSYSQPPTIQNSPVVEIPYSDWYYRWGKSPVDDNGMPLWIYEDTSSAGWQPMTDYTRPSADQQEGYFLWLMIQVPAGHWRHPTLFLPPVSQDLEVYHRHRLIYRSGELKPSNSSKYWIIRPYLIPLESMIMGTESNILFLRIYSDSRNVGINSKKLWLGGQMDIIRMTVKLSVSSFILGFLFCFAGLFSIFVYFRRRKEKPYFALSFGAFAICIGINHMAGSLISHLIIKEYVVWYYLVTIGFLTWPIGLYVFIEQILGRGYKSLIRRLWQIHILYAVVVFLLDITNVFPMTSTIYLLFGLLAIGVFIGIPSVLRSESKDSFEAKILKIGMLVLMLCGLHDILASFGVIPNWQMLFSWGVFAFMLCLAYMLEYRFASAHRQLEEYSLTLEQKVEERTQQLSDKNEVLEQTLQQLKETQDQLIMKEKMASLGDLVSGVAHEMNNPLGVIQSTADIANRGIRKIRSLLQRSQNSDEPNRTGEQLQQSLKLLETSHDTIITASERTAKIVRSLRTFASLDEALFQRVNIHENIDTTLALVYHELRSKATVIKQYGEIPRIQCYPNELNQAFMNLLRNAGQAIEQQGTITITTSADEAQIYIKISDTGKGIPIEDRPKIFDPGFTTQGVGVGKGLGLSIVYNIVQKHHGSIDVNSEAGKGTEISITLPIEQPSE